jgi:glycosyltransferase 2 family protein
VGLGHEPTRTNERMSTEAAPSQESLLRSSLGRHPRDMARLFLAAAVLALCSLIALRHYVNPVEAAIYRQIGLLPSWSSPFWSGLAWVGSVAAIAGAAGIALFMKQIRLGLKLIAGGTLAWGMAQVIEWVIGHRPIPPSFLNGPGGHAPGLGGFAFPSDHLAVAAAMATVASPYLGKAVRNLTWPVVGLVAVADVYVGAHLPIDVLAGAFLGWGAGTLLHLMWGAPGRRTSSEAVRQALELAGLGPIEVEPLGQRLWGPTYFAVATHSTDKLLAEVVQRGHRRAGWGYKLRRFLASLELEDEPRLSTPRHEVEHEAFVTLLAERAGVRTPAVVLARELGHGPALLARREVCGRRLSDLSPDEVQDDLMDEIWRQVSMLGRARIAHHDLRAKNVIVDDGGRPWILDFTFARAGASQQRVAQDVAEMLIALGCLVGAERTVATAQRALPRDDLQRALAYLQPLALPRRIRKQLGRQRYVLAELREVLAERIECSPPSFRSRIKPTTVLSLVVGGGAVYLLLPQIGDIPHLLRAVQNANYAWLVVAFIAGALTFPMAAASYLGATRHRLPLWLTVEAQLASAFTSRTTPGGIGGMGLNLIYLERQGLERGAAVGAVALNQAAGGVVHGLGFFVAVIALGASGTIGQVPVPTGWPVLVAVVACLVAAGIVLGSPFGRRRIVRPSVEVGKELAATLRHPVQAAQLFGGSAGVTIGNGLALAASVAAFNGHASVLTVIAVYVAGSAIAAPAPTPGNLGAVEAALVAGLTGVGLPSAPAVAGVLAFRLLTFWIPMIPGLAAFRYLQHREIV